MTSTTNSAARFGSWVYQSLKPVEHKDHQGWELVLADDGHETQEVAGLAATKPGDRWEHPREPHSTFRLLRKGDGTVVLEDSYEKLEHVHIPAQYKSVPVYKERWVPGEYVDSWAGGSDYVKEHWESTDEVDYHRQVETRSEQKYTNREPVSAQNNLHEVLEPLLSLLGTLDLENEACRNLVAQLITEKKLPPEITKWFKANSANIPVLQQALLQSPGDAADGLQIALKKDRPFFKKHLLGPLFDFMSQHLGKNTFNANKMLVSENATVTTERKKAAQQHKDLDALVKKEVSLKAAVQLKEETLKEKKTAASQVADAVLQADIVRILEGETRQLEGEKAEYEKIVQKLEQQREALQKTTSSVNALEREHKKTRQLLETF